jgi:hypothetical protein
MVICYDKPNRKFVPQYAVKENKGDYPIVVSITTHKLIPRERFAKHHGYVNLLKNDKLYLTINLNNIKHYIYVWTYNELKQSIKCKYEKKNEYIQFYFYYENNWCMITVGNPSGIGAITQTVSTHFYYDTDKKFYYPKSPTSHTGGLFNIPILNLAYDEDEISSKPISDYHTKIIYRFIPKDIRHKFTNEFATLNSYDNKYADFINNSIVENDYRLRISAKITNQVINFGDTKGYYDKLFANKEKVPVIDIFPTRGSYETIVTNINDPYIHLHMSKFDKAINYYYQKEIFRAFKNAKQLGGAGAQGGHAGAFCFINGNVYKKYAVDKKEDIDEGEGEKISELDIDRELLFYWRIHKLHELHNSKHDINISYKYKYILNLYKYSSLPLLSDPSKIDVLNKKCPTDKKFKKGYELGNMYKIKANIEGQQKFIIPEKDERDKYGILDFKVGSYTKLIVDRKLNDVISIETDELQGGGIGGNLKIYSQLILDANSSSNHYGFRCEGFGKPMMTLFFGDKEKEETDEYVGSDIDIFYKNEINGIVTEAYTKEEFQVKNIENDITYHKHNERYYTLNKPVIYDLLDTIYKEIYRYFSGLSMIEFNKINHDILAHFLHINPFNMDNKNIIDFVKSKIEKKLNRPLYSLPPIVTIYKFIEKMGRDSLETYWQKIYEFSKDIFIEQYENYINENEKTDNTPYFTYVCFVGSSIMIRYKLENDNIPVKSVKFFLSDFGHPYMFDKEIGQSISSESETTSTVKEIDFIFKNFIFGGLGYLYVNYLALIAAGFKPTQADVINMNTVASYLNDLINDVLYNPSNPIQQTTNPNDALFAPANRLKTVFTVIQPTIDEYKDYLTGKKRLSYNKEIYNQKCIFPTPK